MSTFLKEKQKRISKIMNGRHRCFRCSSLAPLLHANGDWYLKTGELLCMSCYKKRVKELESTEDQNTEKKVEETGVDLNYSFKKKGKLYEQKCCRKDSKNETRY